MWRLLADRSLHQLMVELVTAAEQRRLLAAGSGARNACTRGCYAPVLRSMHGGTGAGTWRRPSASGRALQLRDDSTGMPHDGRVRTRAAAAAGADGAGGSARGEAGEERGHGAVAAEGGDGAPGPSGAAEEVGGGRARRS